MNAPLAYLVLALLVTAFMGLATVVGLRRWSLLDMGARLMVACIGIHFLGSVASMVVIGAGHGNRLLAEATNILATGAAMAGFFVWQPKRSQRRAFAIGVGLFFALWVAAQAAQGARAEYSAYSAPLVSIAMCAAAGLTLVNKVRVTPDRWTSKIWFWICIGWMLDYGTEVILDPLTLNVVRIRQDLVFSAFYFHLAAGVGAYGLMAWGLFRVGRSVE